MASSIVSDSGISHPRAYGSEPMEVRPRPIDKSSNYFDEETKVEYSCQNGTTFLKASSGLLVLSFVLQTIAVGAPFWSAGWRRDKMAWYEGVWMTCYRTDLENKWICGAYDYLNKKPGIPSWYTFCQALGLMSIVVFLPALLISFFYTMHPKGKMYRGLSYFNYVLTFTTALLPLLMIIVWIAGHPKEDRFPIPFRDEDYDDWPFAVHFSYIFEIFAFIISFVAFALEIFDAYKYDPGQ